MTALLLGSLALFIVIGMPIAVAIGLAATLVVGASGFPLLSIVPPSISAPNSFTLLAIPFFLFAGHVMEYGGISRRIVDFAYGVVGGLRGGLGHVCVLASMLFGGISGSATADTAAVGGLMIPAMRSKRYDVPFACALQASAGTLGMIIPPSLVMVILGVTANISVGRMFLGGIVPGVLLGLSYMVVMYFHARRHAYPTEAWTPPARVVRSFFPTIPPLLTVVIIVGGLVGGVFTPTEAGAVASLYALLLAFAYREFGLKELGHVLVKTAATTGMVMFLIATSSVFGWILTVNRVPTAITTTFLSITNDPMFVFLLINVILLLIGTFLDPTPIIIILVPLLMPIVQAAGIDPVHFGVVFSVNMLVANISPPAGAPLFVVTGIGEVPLAKVSVAILPFLLASTVVLLLITYVPWLVLAIPNAVMGP